MSSLSSSSSGSARVYRWPPTLVKSSKLVTLLAKIPHNGMFYVVVGSLASFFFFLMLLLGITNGDNLDPDLDLIFEFVEKKGCAIDPWRWRELLDGVSFIGGGWKFQSSARDYFDVRRMFHVDLKVTAALHVVVWFLGFTFVDYHIIGHGYVKYLFMIGSRWELLNDGFAQIWSFCTFLISLQNWDYCERHKAFSASMGGRLRRGVRL